MLTTPQTAKGRVQPFSTTVSFTEEAAIAHLTQRLVGLPLTTKTIDSLYAKAELRALAARFGFARLL